MLLSKGADVHASDYNGCTALVLASAMGHVKAMEMMLSNGAKLHRTALACIPEWSSQRYGFSSIQGS